MLWRGRIYSPLPFVRSLWGTRINAGVWGTAAFPSVYRTDVHPFAFLPHSIKWQVISFVSTIAGVVVAATRITSGQRRFCSAAASSAWPTTVAKNIAYALRSDVDSLSGSKLWYRATVAYLHFPSAVRAHDRPHSRSPLAAGRWRCRDGSSDQPRAAAVARRSLARAAADLRAASPKIASGARRGRRPIAC